MACSSTPLLSWRIFPGCSVKAVRGTRLLEFSLVRQAYSNVEVKLKKVRMTKPAGPKRPPDPER